MQMINQKSKLRSGNQHWNKHNAAPSGQHNVTISIDPDDQANLLKTKFLLSVLYCRLCHDQALTGSDFQLWVGSGSELKSRVVGYPRVG